MNEHAVGRDQFHKVHTYNFFLHYELCSVLLGRKKKRFAAHLNAIWNRATVAKHNTVVHLRLIKPNYMYECALATRYLLNKV